MASEPPDFLGTSRETWVSMDHGPFPCDQVRDCMHPIEVQSGSRLGSRGLISIELLVVIRVNECLSSRAPGNLEGIVRGFGAEWGVTW
jgi:hypothetical protein